MGKMGLGYGSEYQLLRYMGRHRNLLDCKILKVLGLEKERIEWLDFNFSGKEPFSKDSELVGIRPFFQEKNFSLIQEQWKNFWPSKARQHNWDAVFKIQDQWFFVEAKARKNEFTKTSIKECEKENKTKIEQVLNETKEFFENKSNVKWIDSKYYQLCNRLAFIYFCEKMSINAKIIYINFINGYKKKTVFVYDNVSDEKQWKKYLKTAYTELGFNNDAKLKKYLINVYIDCSKGEMN